MLCMYAPEFLLHLIQQSLPKLWLMRCADAWICSLHRQASSGCERRSRPRSIHVYG